MASSQLFEFVDGAGIPQFASQVGTVLDRDLVQPEVFEFRFTVDAAGAPTVGPPDNLNVRQGYFFAIHSISGAFENPAVNNGDLTRILLRFIDPAEGKDFFRTAISMARIFGNAGSDGLELRVPYVIPPSGQISIQVNTVLPWGGVAKRCSVDFEGDLVRVDFHEQYKQYLAAKRAAMGM